jgi:hypothetical protein
MKIQVHTQDRHKIMDYGGGCKLVNENDPNPPTFDNNNWISNGNAEINTIIIIIGSPMAMQK